MNLFKEGVMVVEKNRRKDKHDEVKLENGEEVSNLKAYMVCRSLTSRNLLDEKFNWQWHYYFLKNEGMEYLREVLGLPANVFPSTLTKQRPTRPMGAPEGGKGKGRGKGWGKGGEGGGKGWGRGKEMAAEGDFKPEFRGQGAAQE